MFQVFCKLLNFMKLNDDNIAAIEIDLLFLLIRNKND
jgi:hypothetical protein